MATTAPISISPKPVTEPAAVRPDVLAVVRRFWGFNQLRPLQAEAIGAALAGRDSLVVLPTGGGKSLCYQVPPLITDGLVDGEANNGQGTKGTTDIVISPLISLMKDQVDGLAECGYHAAALYGGLDDAQRREVEAGLGQGKYRLLFVAPERANTSWFLNLAKRIDVRRIAIDEAHCISHWGHDFRPDYRQLAALRQQFPTASFHAFTATATPRVRSDIVVQLGLRDPAELVGAFDRPNLVYRVLPQVDVYAQAIEIVRRHANEAIIIYCISRKDTEHMAATLKANGIVAEAYHAGLDSGVRHRVQDAFSAEELNVVVATVAFGMGIDRSNVRCVLHTAMPKTIEHYQQETGRAGRDGLPAECVLLYSYADAMRWESLLRKSAADAANPAEVIEAQLQLLKQMQRLCNSPTCRHRAFVEYFGQEYERDNCGSCDVCLADVEGMEDGTVTAQKILSCVARVNENFGVGHVVDVLTGSDTEMVRRCKHDQLTTYGLLKELPKKHVQSMVYQLVDQGLLDRTPDDRPILKLNDESWQVLRGQREVKLLRPKQKASRAKVDAQSWEGVDRELFDHLRTWRQHVAKEHGVPPYVILHDTTLRGLAGIRPTSQENLRQVTGMGEKRIANFGASLLEIINTFCDEHELTRDQTSATIPDSTAQADVKTYLKPKSSTEAKSQAFELFRQGWSVDDVKHKINRARSTTIGYLVEFIGEEKPTSIEAWVPVAIYQQVVAAAANSEDRRLTPIFERLDARVPYDTIRLVLAHIESQAD